MNPRYQETWQVAPKHTFRTLTGVQALASGDVRGWVTIRYLLPNGG